MTAWRTRPRLLSRLGPGLITGAADDDPSGIATYSQAGAQFGYGVLWTVVVTTPLMVAIQLVSARIGRITGQGIVANLRGRYPRALLALVLGLLIVANTINIAADLAAMGEALRLVAGGGEHGHALVFGALCLLLQVFVPYHRYVRLLKWLTLFLFAYVATALVAAVDWRAALRGMLVPSPRLDAEYLLIVLAVLGTTISPYLFFWQAAQEVEDLRLAPRAVPLRDQRRGGKLQLRRIAVDTWVGMIVSNVVAAAIMITTAATLHGAGITSIQTSAQAAEALRPLAGEFTFLLFAVGVIGTGMLAVPVLAGSAAYALSEAFGWPATLEAKPSAAPRFYAIIAAAMLVAVAIDFTPLDPIQMLFWSAVINGVVAAPIMAVMLVLACDRQVMGAFVLPRGLRIVGWAATALMALVILALVGAALLQRGAS